MKAEIKKHIEAIKREVLMMLIQQNNEKRKQINCAKSATPG
jgi:hypothetical protein